MEAVQRGHLQIVNLAAGLDARAWRMTKLPSEATMFEIDAPEAHVYKREKIATIETEGGAYPGGPTCRRVEIGADLSDAAAWTKALIDSGFDVNKPSTFIVEGLLMYLPPSAPAKLLLAAAQIMAPGSEIIGDSFAIPEDGVAALQKIFGPVLARYGTAWTFLPGSTTSLESLLHGAGFATASTELISPINAMFRGSIE